MSFVLVFHPEIALKDKNTRVITYKANFVVNKDASRGLFSFRSQCICKRRYPVVETTDLTLASSCVVNFTLLECSLPNVSFKKHESVICRTSSWFPCVPEWSILWCVTLTSEQRKSIEDSQLAYTRVKACRKSGQPSSFQNFKAVQLSDTRHLVLVPPPSI